MPKHRKTIGKNPLDQLALRGKGNRAFIGTDVPSEMRDALLKGKPSRKPRKQQGSALKKWFKSIFG